MSDVKPGQRLYSSCCDTEIMVIKYASGETIGCGGKPMVDKKLDPSGEIENDFCSGSLIGKRYVDSGGLVEFLCVKAGEGSLSLGHEALVEKASKALPSSD